MNAPSDKTRLTGEEIATALIGLDIDPDAERIAQLQTQIDAGALTAGEREVVVRNAVEAAIRAGTSPVAGAGRVAPLAVAESLRDYLKHPGLVDGWITPDAVALKDGSVKYTKYFRTPNGGLLLRSALEPHEAESPQGLVRRFESGERFLPDVASVPRTATFELDRPSFRIVVATGDDGSGTVVSSTLDEENPEPDARASFRAVKLTVLGHALEGVDVLSPTYLAGLDRGVDLIRNRLKEDAEFSFDGGDIPADPEGRNDERASWAGVAIAAFRDLTNCDQEDAVSDLMANIMHFCDRNGMSFSAELQRARMHYEAETYEAPSHEPSAVSPEL